MNFNTPIRFAMLLAALFVFAGIAAAQGPVTSSNSTTSELEMTANVNTALQLNISTGNGGATVNGNNATGLFSINFGAVDGLGLTTPSAGISVVKDGAGALYKSPINLTPVYSGFTSEKADISVEAGNSGNEELAREADASISAGSTVAVPHAAATRMDSASVTERWVGFYIPRTEAAGAKTATLIYTVTMNLN
jgi:hypothetical protein